MEAETSASIKMMNQDLIKLDQFDGSNFGRWQEKVKFLLTALRIVYILNCEPLLEPGDNASENEKKEWQRRNDDEVMCRDHILNALSDRLYNFYKSFDSAKEIWKALEYKYKVQEEGTNKFLISEYNDFSMLDGIPILHQVHELQDIANKIYELDGKLPESFQVGMIIAKLPPSWKDYRKKLLHREKKFTLEKIQKHLRIEEESSNRDKKGEAEFNSKVNYVDAASEKSFHALQVKKEDNIKAFRILDLESNVIVESRDVTFFECKFISDFRGESSKSDFVSNSRTEPNIDLDFSTVLSAEPRRSQRHRKGKDLGKDFISPNSIVFLVEGSQEIILNQTPIILNVDSDPMT
ncbi:hypothetical protein RJ639_043223 [Escallonia herrerae]|uniref:Uncharacterized protein n=1 Tax=Escallonia herrerae TaxID=1293975 RepID=A0AA88WG97_9ASTE|nr:hypothetical protein RJ639_043223 [Escallonia herrerae]